MAWRLGQRDLHVHGLQAGYFGELLEEQSDKPLLGCHTPALKETDLDNRVIVSATRRGREQKIAGPEVIEAMSSLLLGVFEGLYYGPVNSGRDEIPAGPQPVGEAVDLYLSHVDSLARNQACLTSRHDRRSIGSLGSIERFGALRKLLIAGAVIVGMFAAVPAAQAGTITVNTTEDTFNVGGSTCSLREAITAAQTDSVKGGCPAGSGADEIKLQAGQYDITRAGVGEDGNATGDFDIVGTGALTISPQGVTDVVIVNGNGLDRVFDQQGNNSLSIKNLQVKGGVANADDGGAIRNSVGTMTLEGVTVSGSTTKFSGGGIAVYSSLVASNSTLSGNKADGSGGGLYVTGGSVGTVKSSTITDNTADQEADGNGDGGGFRSTASTVNFFNVIDASNHDLSPVATDKSPDCFSDVPQFYPRYVLTTQAVNTVKCLTAFDPGSNILTSDPKIGPLDANLGITPVHPLLVDSQAIGAGGTAAPDLCPATDQLGNPRPAGACAIGAVQYIEPTPGKATLLIDKIGPKKKKVKRGKTIKVKLTIKNGGDAAAAGVKACLVLKVKKTKKALKIKGPKCKTIGALAAGASKTVAIKLSAKKKAKKKSYTVTSSVAGTGLPKATRAFKVKVK